MGHHYNQVSHVIVPPGKTSHPNFEVVFINTINGEQVRMSIPPFGMFEDPNRAITPDEVEQLAHVFGQHLQDLKGDNMGGSGTPA